MWMIRSKTLACSWGGEREQERCPIRPTAGLFLESGTNAFTLPSSSLHPVSFHLCVVAYNTDNSETSLSNNGSVHQRLKIKQSNQGSVKRGVCGLGWVDLSLKWADWPAGQQSALFLGPIKCDDTKIVQRRPSADLSVTLRGAVNLKVTHLGWWKGWCSMIFKKEQVMTKIFLAVGRWHSVSLASDGLVKGLDQRACGALRSKLIFTAITSLTLWGQKRWTWQTAADFGVKAGYQLFTAFHHWFSQWLQIKK